MAVHFHIRWSNSKLDWEAFLSREEALARATELVRFGETFVIEPFEGACPRCNNLASRNDALTGS